MGNEVKNLAEFIVNDLFKWMADDRKAILEPQWRRNYDAFRSRYNSDSLKRWKATEGNGWRSKIFCRLTKQKVVTGFNHVSALMLQNGKLPWSISPTPVPETATGVYLDPDEAEIRATRMSRRIDDDLTECRAAGPYTTSILEGSIYGLSWLRGPILRPYGSMAVDFGLPGVDGLGMHFNPDLIRRFGRFTMRTDTKAKPVIDSPSVWNMFWDLESPDYQTGQGIIFLEMMSKGRFAELIRRPGYDRSAGEKIVSQFEGRDEGTTDSESLGPLREEYGLRRRVIPVYTFYGRVPVKYLEDSEAKDKVGAEEAEIYCVCAKAQTPVVIRKPVINPLPYRQIFMAPWQELPHEPGGVGVPEDVEDTQMILNGLIRSMMDNKALSSNLMSVWNPRFLAAGQNKALYPGKAFETDEAVEDAGKAIHFFSPPDVTGNTPQLIELFKQLSDDESGLARIMDGSSGGTRKTAFEMSKVTEAGNKMIGSICRNHDEKFFGPLISAFYHYHMLCGDDDAIKGDFQIAATGFQSYQDKAIRGRSLLELAQFALASDMTSRYGKWHAFLSQLAKVRDFDPDELWYSDEEISKQKQAETLAQMLPGAGGLPGE